MSRALWSGTGLGGRPGTPGGGGVEPDKVGSWVSKWIRSTRAGQGARVYQAWQERVDPSIRGRAWIQDLRSGTLWIQVDSSAALEELSTYGRESILATLAPEGVRDLRFTVSRRRPPVPP